MAGGGAGDVSLKDTPTWAVALVCAVIVLISVGIEHVIHHLHGLFQRRQKKAMLEALEKIKAELMLLGFISLLLTIGQQPISKICVPANVAATMHPCMDEKNQQGGGQRRKMLWDDGGGEGRPADSRRVLAGASNAAEYCSQFDGQVSLISQTGIHQLHIFIFALAVFHVLYSAVTMRLAQAKMKKWKAWESLTTTQEYQFANDPARFRFARQTSFVRRHGGISGTPGIKWIVAFFRQFTGSVSKVDYLTLRLGFINAHLSPHSNFNFHKYIRKSMEDDFKKVVGVSLPLWLLAIFMMLVNVYGWYSLYWISYLPLLILVVVGTKLELVIMKLAHQIQERHAVVVGSPIVQPSNELFWFGRPDWILKLIHVTVFENSFQLAHFLWTWYSFGLKSCFHDELPMTITRICMGVLLQFLCSYITFPLYALVTQMGSDMKKSIFEEQTAVAFQKWRDVVKKRKELRELGLDIPYGRVGCLTPSRESSSPMPLLHRHTTDSADIESATSDSQTHRRPAEETSSQLEPQGLLKRSSSEPRRSSTAPARFVDSDGGEGR